MAATNGKMQELMTDAALKTAVSMTAKMFGLSEETVTKVLQVGLPMLAKMANENPEALKNLYAQSVKFMPEPMQEFYAKLAENPEAQQRLVDEFKTAAGPMMESLNREAARAAGTTEPQAERVMATSYPAVASALGRDAADTSEQGFAQRLKTLVA